MCVEYVSVSVFVFIHEYVICIENIDQTFAFHANRINHMEVLANARSHTHRNQIVAYNRNEMTVRAYNMCSGARTPTRNRQDEQSPSWAMHKISFLGPDH